MFKLNPNPTFVGTASIAVPGGEAEKLRLVFKHKTRDDAKAFFERAAKSDESESKLLLEIIAGWEDVDAEFSEDALSQLLQNYHNAAQAIFEGYMAELTAARRGN
jgi:hypothetical protein